MSYNTRKFSDEELLEELRRVALLLGKPALTRADFDHHAKVCAGNVYTRFGGWRRALERAGLEGMFSKPVLGDYASLRGETFPNEVLLDEVRRVAKAIGMPILIKEDFNAYSKVDVDTITRRFGSWQATLERAGLGHLYCGSHRRHPDEYLLAQLRRVAELVGKPVLTPDGFDNHSRLKAKTLSRRFGSWRGALERAGLTSPHKEQS